MSLIGVKFLESWDRYNAGERAGFKPNVAQKLADNGIATILSDEDDNSTDSEQEQDQIKVSKPFDRDKYPEMPYFAMVKAGNDLAEEKGIDRPDSRKRSAYKSFLEDHLDDPLKYLHDNGYLKDQ